MNLLQTWTLQYIDLKVLFLHTTLVAWKQQLPTTTTFVFVNIVRILYMTTNISDTAEYGVVNSQFSWIFRPHTIKPNFLSQLVNLLKHLLKASSIWRLISRTNEQGEPATSY